MIKSSQGACPSERPEAAPAQRPTAQQAQHAILVVDDEPRIVELLRRELGRIYTVRTATSAAQALETLRTERIALVIADQRMPEMSGTELMTRILERQPEVIRILLTGYTDLNALVAAINQGQVYRYVTKPWEPEELRIVVRQGIEKYELEKQNRVLVHDLRMKNFELYRTLEELNRAQEEILQHERQSAVGRMINMIVHDLKNPLTAIIGLSELLSTMPTLAEAKRLGYYRMIHEEGQRILQMILEIMEFVRGETPDLELEPCDLGAFLEEFRQELEARLNGSGVALRIETRDDCEVLLDREKFRRVLQNLVAHAREVMPEGGELRLCLDADDERICLRVSDTGSGIPEEAQAHLFEPFFVRGMGRGASRGSSLGLPIVRRILEAHHGEIVVESSGPAGTTFCVRLPRRGRAEQLKSANLPVH